MTLDRIHLCGQIRIGIAEVVQCSGTLLRFVPSLDVDLQPGRHSIVDAVYSGLASNDKGSETLGRFCSDFKLSSHIRYFI